MMAAHVLGAVGQVVRQHMDLFLVLGFLASILTAYWYFGLAPYRQRPSPDLLTPWHVARPAIPGVLVRYAAWEWVHETGLTPFGRWVYQELNRQNLPLVELARRAGMTLDDLVAIVSVGAAHEADAEMIRTLAGLLGAREPLIEQLLRAELAATTRTE